MIFNLIALSDNPGILDFHIEQLGPHDIRVDVLLAPDPLLAYITVSASGEEWA